MYGWSLVTAPPHDDPLEPGSPPVSHLREATPAQCVTCVLDSKFKLRTPPQQPPQVSFPGRRTVHPNALPRPLLIHIGCMIREAQPSRKRTIKAGFV